jgi:uridylate kinase
VCRLYQGYARLAGVKKARELDWIGIYATRFNAALVKSLFSSLSTDDLSYKDLKRQAKRFSVLVLGGIIPGASSDHTTVQIARTVGSRALFNLSNIEYVYDKDPRAHRDAKPHKRLTWQEYFGIIGSKRVPGGNYPFDPVAARLAARLKITVNMINGRNLPEVKKALAGKSFKGTIIT